MSGNTYVLNAFTILSMINMFLLEWFCIHSFDTNTPMAKDGLILQFAKFTNQKRQGKVGKTK
jgi:hypothetical protein